MQNKQTYRPAWDFLSKAPDCKSYDELNDLLAAALRPFAFDRFSCVSVRDARGKANPHVVFGRSYEDWDSYYLSRGYLDADPCMTKLYNVRNAFAWSDTPWEDLTPVGRQIFAEAAEAGARNGLVVPVPGEDRELFCVRFSSPEPTFDPEARLTLSTLAMSYCVIGTEKMPVAARRKAQKSPLSGREAQCLAWVSEGKSDWDISEILHISQWTVHEHIERAKSKLGVRSRVQAVVRSAQNGWLPNNPSD